MIIFLDLDGVIINWVGGVCKWFDIPYQQEEVTNKDNMLELIDISYKEFWTDLSTPDFWEYLDFYPQAKQLIGQLKKYGDVVFISSPALGCAGYRQNWIQHNLPEFFITNKYILTSSKEYCANPNTVLIDDFRKNCQDFVANGGNAILYPQPWNGHSNINKKNKNDLVLKKIKEFKK